MMAGKVSASTRELAECFLLSRGLIDIAPQSKEFGKRFQAILGDRSYGRAYRALLPTRYIA